MVDIPEIGISDKERIIKEVANFDDRTIGFFEDYFYREPLIDKLYKMAVDAEKWRNQKKNEG